MTWKKLGYPHFQELPISSHIQTHQIPAVWGSTVPLVSGAGPTALWLCGAPCWTASCGSKAGGGEVSRGLNWIMDWSCDDCDGHDYGWLWLWFWMILVMIMDWWWLMMTLMALWLLVEDLYADRHIQVLVSTATLAWGRVLRHLNVQEPGLWKSWGHEIWIDLDSFMLLYVSIVNRFYFNARNGQVRTSCIFTWHVWHFSFNLVASSASCAGVNLPAHTVIIKGTQAGSEVFELIGTVDPTHGTHGTHGTSGVQPTEGPVGWVVSHGHATGSHWIAGESHDFCSFCVRFYI